IIGVCAPPLACWRALGLGSDIDELLRSCLPLACWRACRLGSDIDELLRSWLPFFRVIFPFRFFRSGRRADAKLQLTKLVHETIGYRDAGHRLFSFRLIFFDRALGGCI